MPEKNFLDVKHVIDGIFLVKSSKNLLKIFFLTFKLSISKPNLFLNSEKLLVKLDGIFPKKLFKNATRSTFSVEISIKLALNILFQLSLRLVTLVFTLALPSQLPKVLLRH